MNKSEFKERWESDENGSDITFDDVAACAIKWGITKTPRAMPMDQVRYEVLKAANTTDAAEYKPATLVAESEGD